ncbi:MAG TPA: hypothetical protein VFX20_18150 [Steroidobacteraceae bacterium]|nr:hypothetical protein [Steroidobacteraceae bacterium]
MSQPDSQKTFMGNPCARGHSGLRYRCNGACVDCTTHNSERRKQKLLLEREQQAAAGPAETASDG